MCGVSAGCIPYCDDAVLTQRNVLVIGRYAEIVHWGRQEFLIVEDLRARVGADL